MLNMNRLTRPQRTQVLSALVEGNSIRAAVRMTGVAKNTIVKLLAEIGKVCADYLDANLRKLPCKRIQCDEIWSFCYAKQKRVPTEKQGQLGSGDVWTWVAIDADTKLVASWFVGPRDAGTAYAFMQDLSERLASRVQLITDGHKACLATVESAFGSDIDYAMLVKVYGADAANHTTYSPAECLDRQPIPITGRPDPKHIVTSYAERQDLTMRMRTRRFTRGADTFSKRVENHAWAVALHFMYYNFCRVCQTLRVTPAIAAGVVDHVWEISEIVALSDSL
jgi:IS1 family transposase